MNNNIIARELMRPSFIRLGKKHTLREALAIVLANQTRGEADKILIVLDKDSSFSGILTTRNLLRVLLPEDIINGDSNLPSEEILFNAMHDKSQLPVDHALTPNIPLIGPETRLLELIQIMHQQYLEVLPVVENKKLVGVIYLTDVFKAASELALATQEHSK